MTPSSSKGGMQPAYLDIYTLFQKLTTTLRMMAYGILTDLIDDNFVMGESEATTYVKRFVLAILDVFGGEYLRYSNAQYTSRLLLP
jgi:hypothetical protein